MVEAIIGTLLCVLSGGILGWFLREARPGLDPDWDFEVHYDLDGRLTYLYLEIDGETIHEYEAPEYPVAESLTPGCHCDDSGCVGDCPDCTNYLDPFRPSEN